MHSQSLFNLLSCSRDEMRKYIEKIGEKSFRSDQLWTWIYNRGVLDFQSMTNLSRDFRSKLEKIAVIPSLKLIDKQESNLSGTKKFLWELKDGQNIESVYIPEKSRRTVCLSSQVGCALDCQFCATGKMGFIRNLDCHEICGQILTITREIGQKPTNIVIMGMGEPFLNYQNVIKALFIINDPEGIAIGQRKITISTAGIVPKLYEYADQGLPFKLAISLNATTDRQRTKLMPINRKYPIQDLIKAAKYYTIKQKKRITFEYVLIRGVNDSPEDALRLMTLVRGVPCKVNLIAYNSTRNQYMRPDEEKIHAFAESIRTLRAPVTVRLSHGHDINGACGQLATGKIV